jgi:hypothetical protein
MPDSIQDLRSLIRSAHQRFDLESMPEAIVQESTDLPPNKVRVWRMDIRQNVVVNGFKYEAGLHVWLKMMPDGAWQMLVPAIAASTPRFGEGVGARTIPPGAQETVAWSIPALGLTEGRLSASIRGGLYVHTDSFTYDGGYFVGGGMSVITGQFDPTVYDESIEDYLPEEAGQVRWVGRYFDPSSGSFHFSASTPRIRPSVNHLDEADIGEFYIPGGCYPLGAVATSYGMTTLQGGRFTSWRLHVGKKEVRVDQIMTDGRGLPMTDGRGFLMWSERP